MWDSRVISRDAVEFETARTLFHASLINSGLLTLSDDGVPSNADAKQPASRAFASHIARAVAAEAIGEKLVSQTSGKKFEEACRSYLEATFLQLGHLRPGSWTVRHVTGRKGLALADYAQYAHLGRLAEASNENPHLLSILGNAYAISPDIVVSRAPVADSVINSRDSLVDRSIARRTTLRASNGQLDYLHAVVSCKWTLRSDRAQNARSEALNLVRNRNGPLPHVVVVTAEPTPSRISSLALGTGDLDSVYHFALPELIDAVAEVGNKSDNRLLTAMVEGGRLKDISDLPLDLAL